MYGSSQELKRVDECNKGVNTVSNMEEGGPAGGEAKGDYQRRKGSYRGWGL